MSRLNEPHEQDGFETLGALVVIVLLLTATAFMGVMVG